MMGKEGISSGYEQELQKPVQVFRYQDVQFDPQRAFIHALHHKGYNLDFKSDPTALDFMIVKATPMTAGKVLPLMAMYEESTLYQLYMDVFDGNPVPIEAVMRQIPMETVHPQNRPYINAEFQHSVTDNLFVRAYERNQDILTSFTETQHPLHLEAEFVPRYRAFHDRQIRGKYENSKSRAITGSNSQDLPFIIQPFIEQMLRERPELRV